MNEQTQAGSSNSEQLLPGKRKRGRPRKDPTLKRRAVASMPPGFSIKEHRSSHQAVSNDPTNSANIGQPVTGIIDASFDGGYLLTVKIGDSSTNLRGVVFKPGSFIPVTAGNDVAPQVQMIKRNEVCGSNGGGGGGAALRQINHGSGSSLPQSTTTVVTTKGRQNVSSSKGSGRGTLVPVVLQPIAISGVIGSSSSSVSHTIPEPSVSRDKDVVVTAEPLAMVLPERPPPPPPPQPSSASNLDVVHEQEEIEGPVESMSSPPAAHVQSLYTPMSFKNYGTGRMSQLLQAVQEKVKNPFAVGGVDSHEFQNPK